MKKEVVERYVWSKEEVRALLIEDLTRRGIKIEGESALCFTDMSAILKVWLPRMPQDETFSGGEGGGESKGRMQTRTRGGDDGPQEQKANGATEDSGNV